MKERKRKRKKEREREGKRGKERRKEGKEREIEKGVLRFQKKSMTASPNCQKSAVLLSWGHSQS